MRCVKKVLKMMMEELKNAHSLYQPSNFWREVNKTHLQQLTKKGCDNFKRTVNLRYFNWGILGILVHQLSPILSECKKGNFAPFFRGYFVNPQDRIPYQVSSGGIRSALLYKTSFGFISSLLYKIYIAYLFDYVSRIDTMNILDILEEPRTGNPFLIRYKNKSISQDLCNSVYEYYSITSAFNVRKKSNIAEIGAGYGRLAYVFLNIIPTSTYCIIDIPPALFIAQEYLTTIFPREKIFPFRHFSSYKEIQKEFEHARIRFLMAHQIELLPDKQFDLMITESSLHEMTREQIVNYIYHINRLINGYFYTKQWRKSRTKDNQYIKESEYPKPPKWSVLYKRRHAVQRMFFEALYKIDKNS